MMAATPAVVALRAGISRLSKSRSTVDEGDADAELLMHLSGHIVSVHACDADGVAGLALDNISRLTAHGRLSTDLMLMANWCRRSGVAVLYDRSCWRCADVVMD
jgi:hypothetical protein